MNVLHISTECYPAAKAGGMGDVVGSLPKYLKATGVEGSVLIPKYQMPWFGPKQYEIVYSGAFNQRGEHISFAIELVKDADLGFPLYVANIPGKFDRNSVYLDVDGEGYKDEVERNISFQRSALIWLNDDSSSFNLVHCHDHMTGLIPFFMQYGNDFENLRDIPSFFSIHNAAYHGKISWFHKETLPPYIDEKGGFLDWDAHIHSLACAIKCAWKVNTVSPSYMKEIQSTSNSLSPLFKEESEKCIGILNGIDVDSWDPKTDSLIKYNRKRTWNDFKVKNKAAFAEEYGLDPETAWVSFIGRFSYQKGVDTLTPAIRSLLDKGRKVSFIVLGSGSKALEDEISALESKDNVKTLIMYNEAVAHQIYASSDFIMMPSRFEPCGLNQMFAMRYGTVPIVRATGGLIDTVKESKTDGTGFSYEEATAIDLENAIERALDLYEDVDEFKKLRSRCLKQNFSWAKSAKTYASEYKKLI